MSIRVKYFFKPYLWPISLESRVCIARSHAYPQTRVWQLEFQPAVDCGDFCLLAGGSHAGQSLAKAGFGWGGQGGQTDLVYAMINFLKILWSGKWEGGKRWEEVGRGGKMGSVLVVAPQTHPPPPPRKCTKNQKLF